MDSAYLIHKSLIKLQRCIVVNSVNALKFVAMQIKNTPINKVNEFAKGTLMEHLGIEVTEIGEDYIVAKMPVDNRTHQPLGMLHGGASVALIESLGSIGSSLMVDLEKAFPVGLEVNANHVGAVKSGFVEARGTIVHAGKRTHVWQVDIHTLDTKRLICTGRLTVMIVEKKD
jgi:1,4-dihydroxy-2-naphthoyl-CoA hydrolase